MEKWERKIMAFVVSLTIKEGVDRLKMMEVLLAHVLGCAEMMKMRKPELLKFVNEKIAFFGEKWKENNPTRTKGTEKRINEIKEQKKKGEAK